MTDPIEPDAIEPVEASPPDVEAPVTETPADPPEPVVEDTADIEHDGRTYKVPRPVLPLLMRQADYSRQAQELAEKSRQLDGERDTFSRSTETERQMLADGRDLIALDWQIQQLEANDFAALQQQDPNRATQLFWQLTQLKGQRERKGRELQQRIAERQFQREREAAARRDRAQAVIARDIEGWSPELQGRLASFALANLGITANELAQVEDPRLVKLLHLAHLGQQATQKIKAAAASPAIPPSPTRTVGGVSPAGRNPERMTTEEWMEHRKSQLRKGRN